MCGIVMWAFCGLSVSAAQQPSFAGTTNEIASKLPRVSAAKAFRGDGRSSAGEVKKALAKLNLAFKNRDAAAIKRSMIAEHIAILPYYAKPQTVAEQISTLIEFKIAEVKTGKVQLLFLGKNVAVVTYRVEYKGTYKGAKLLSPNIATAVWVRRGGQWLEASYQETPLQGK